MNVRQANGSGVVHVAGPRMEQTYCGRVVDEEEWVVTSEEADCDACGIRAGAPAEPEQEDARG